jgi:opacity protein-like surface antigen
MSVSRRGLRGSLLAAASVLAIAASAAASRAADLPTMKPATPPAPVVASSEWWTSIEGGWVMPGSDPNTYGFTLPFVGPPQAATINKGSGWTGRIGIGYQPALSPWDFAAFARYTETRRKRNDNLIGSFSCGFVSTCTNGIVGATKNRESHLVLDFQVGRDLGIGGGPGTSLKATAGLRYANFQSTTTGTFFTSSSPLFPFKAKSSMEGFGPRLGLEGKAALGGGLGLEYGAGVFGLFANEQFSETPGLFVLPQFVTGWKNAFVPGLDGSAAVTYAVTANTTLSLGYHAEFYSGAMLEPSSIDLTTGVVSLSSKDRLDQGPLVKLTLKW